MLRWALGRTFRAALTVWAAITLVFLLVRMVPGDPAAAILGEAATVEERAALRERLHLDRSLGAQYVAFLGDVADGSLGRSFRERDRAVSDAILEALPSTLALAATALLVAWAIAVPLGTLAAMRRASAYDLGARTLAVLGAAIPAIWLGPLLVLAFSVELRWLPMPGDEDAGLAGLVLPATTVGAAMAAILVRQTRAAMIETLPAPYVLAARARGLSPLGAALGHALPNAIVPVITVAAAQLGALLSGSVVAERVFERDGLGTLMLDAFAARDIPVVTGCALVVAVIYVAVNLAADVAHAALDPRVRTAREAGAT